MALVTFQDLPSTSTPLNAENLNNNFNELNSKSVIRVGLGANTSLTIANAYTNVLIPCDTVTTQKDNSNNRVFTLANNKVTINKAGWYMVSANIMCNTSDTSQTPIGNIYQTRANNTTNILAEGYMRTGVSGTRTIALTSVPIELSVGDKISLNIQGSATGSISVSGTTNGRFTYLTIQEI